MQADFLLMVVILFNTFCGSGEIIAELYLFLLQASFTERQELGCLLQQEEFRAGSRAMEWV